jgi:hypothetical protein
MQRKLYTATAFIKQLSITGKSDTRACSTQGIETRSEYNSLVRKHEEKSLFAKRLHG